MIDTRDLPAPVQRAVRGLEPAISSDGAAAYLRYLAASSYAAIGSLWPTSQWHHVQEQLALCAGYLTAATRLEEERGTP